MFDENRIRLRNFTKIGSNDEIRASLSDLAARLKAVGAEIFNLTDLDVGCRVYPAIAESTAMQIELLARLLDESIEITANVCRTVFEINVAFRYCLSSNTRLDGYATQAGTDEISIYKSIKSLADEDTDPTQLHLLDSHIAQIRKVLRKHGKSLKPERPSLYQMAKEVGLKKEYESMYGIYSKYVHASAWFVLRRRDHIDLPMYRLPMQIYTQLYAADTLKRLEDLKDSAEQ